MHDVWTFASLGVGETFVFKKEAINGNCCIYRKIAPIALDGMVRNAARLLKTYSEFVTFKSHEPVAKVVQ